MNCIQRNGESPGTYSERNLGSGEGTEISATNVIILSISAGIMNIIFSTGVLIS